MSVGERLKNRVRGAVETVAHGYDYARHLVRGNQVRNDMSWTRADAPPVILVHGFLGTRGTMQPLTRRFQADGRVVFSYAYGTFNLASIRRSAEDLVSHLRGICEKLDVPKVDMVGYSMGGLIGLHAVKFMQGQNYIRRLVMMGSPLRGTWVGLAGVATVGVMSPSVWQVLPGSPFLEDLLAAPVPAGMKLRQIHAASDAFCPPPGPIVGVAARDYVMLPGGHSSLVVAEPFYAACREFFDADDRAPAHDEPEFSFETLSESDLAARASESGPHMRLVSDYDAAE
ncbi:esterase/lipase family protein [Nannocystaceae bacterium ST9]